ncbi:MAG: Crp/Fnr family transcriptional regulator, partial [Bacteroidota bacterium]
MIREINISKGQFLQKEGEYNTKGYIVKSGLLRSYSIDAKGKEHIFMFAPENWIIADTTPPHLPSELYIDALEDTRAVVFKKGEEDNPDVQKLFSRLNVLQKRIIMLMSASSIERYEHFIETYPNIIQRVPQRMIASYLG